MFTFCAGKIPALLYYLLQVCGCHYYGLSEDGKVRSMHVYSNILP